MRLVAKQTNILFAGFGGQGLLFAGKLLATAGLVEGREVSWLPSYGPEMRGGTANCSVCLSDDPIGSPMVTEPEVLVAMNQPSFDMFISKVVPGGIAIIDTTLVQNNSGREDIDIFPLPATTFCEENELKGLANVLLAGKVIRESGCASVEAVEEAIRKSVPPKRAHLLEPNLRAFNLGLEDETSAR